MRQFKYVISLSIVLTLLASGISQAQPVNTTLPAGWSWVNLGNASYDTGNLTTDSGGVPGQTSPPYSDTSFGIMNEPSTPWFTGNDLSSQQFIQLQDFGDLGAASPSPAPWGFASAPPAGDSQQRFYNYGYQGTIAGSNFPAAATEQRTISVPHWNNANPDAGGVAVGSQEVWIPVSAKISVDVGWGGDEMYFDMIGGGSGPETQYKVTVDHDTSYSITGAGAYTGGSSGEIVYTASVQNLDAGPGAYQAANWGQGPTSNAFDVSGMMSWDTTTGSPVTQGIPENSIGTSIFDLTGMREMTIISSMDVIDNGGTFDVVFDSTATLLNILRVSGIADGRFSYGPGMFGQVQYTVEYERYLAMVPEPGGLVLLASCWLLNPMRGRRR